MLMARSAMWSCSRVAMSGVRCWSSFARLGVVKAGPSSRRWPVGLGQTTPTLLSYCRTVKERRGNLLRNHAASAAEAAGGSPAGVRVGRDAESAPAVAAPRQFGPDDPVGAHEAARLPGSGGGPFRAPAGLGSRRSGPAEAEGPPPESEHRSC